MIFNQSESRIMDLRLIFFSDKKMRLCNGACDTHRGGGGVSGSQTEVVPMLVRAPQNWTREWRNPWCQNLPLNGVEQYKIYP